MSNRTAWAGSSLPSDRIKPQTRPTTPKNKPKAKDGASPASSQAPKSAAIRGLEATIKKLQNELGDQKDPGGGCFCLARTHALSPYCPLCTRCGLLLCMMNYPYFACPHCTIPLFSPTAKDALLDRLRTELADTITKEEQDAERAQEEARQAAGAFPTLSGGEAVHQRQQQQQQQSHKVLSLNSKTKHVTVAKYTPPPQAPLPSIMSAQMKEPEKDAPPHCVRAPPRETIAAQSRPSAGRPWVDMRGDGFVRVLTYVKDPQLEKERMKEERKVKKAKKKQEESAAESVEKEGERVSNSL